MRKMRYLLSTARYCFFLVVALLAVVFGLGLKSVHAEPVIQGYASDSALPKGMVVQLVKDSKTKVEPASNDALARIFGIVVDPNDAPVTLTAEGETSFVATQGKYQVLVSIENGAVKTGDYISMSSSKGIAAKATVKQSHIVGRAVESFDGKNNTVSGSGSTAFGRIVVELNVSRNPIQSKDKNYLPDFLRKTAENISGKPVQPARIYVGIILLLVSGYVSGSLVYAGVRNAIISIGRNPLGKKKITRGLIQVLLISMIIFILGIFGVYLLIKL